jgi:hypothetical protein
MPVVGPAGSPPVDLSLIQHARIGAQASGNSPENTALGHLVRAGDSATVNVSVGGKGNVGGVDVDGKATASIQATYNADGSYDITLSRTGELNGTVNAGGGDDAEPSEKKSTAIPIGLGGIEGDDPFGETPPKTPDFVPVVGLGGIPGITVVPGETIPGQTKPAEGGNGSGNQGVVTTPEESGEKTTPSAQASAGVSVTYSVTVHVQSRGAAADAMKALGELAAAPNLGGSLVDNPIMNQLNGKSGNVTGVAPQTLDFLQKSVSTYGETLTGQGSAMSGIETSFGKNDLTNSKINLQDQGQVSISRTVTQNGSQTAGTVAYAVSAQNQVGPNVSTLGTNFAPQTPLQTTYTQTWNLKGSGQVADPEGALTGQGLWQKPDQTQQQTQTQTTIGGSDALPYSSTIVQTDARTSTTTYDRADPNSTPKTSVSNSMSTTQNSTINVGGDSLISGSATLSQPIFP